MDYILTFDDGSSAYLAHHGVKGMKWGVWNEETRARYMYTGDKSKGRRFLDSMKKDMAFNIPVSAGIGAAAGVMTANPLAGLVKGGVVLGVWTGYDLASNGLAIARGRKTYQERLEESRREYMDNANGKRNRKR